jgi:hypothetical protein
MKDNLTSNQTEPNARQSTYSLLVRSEKEQRSYFETVIYALFILCAIFSVCQFVQQPVTIPTQLGGIPVAAVCSAEARCI